MRMIFQKKYHLVFISMVAIMTFFSWVFAVSANSSYIPADIKPIKRTTAESLFFDPTAPGATSSSPSLWLSKGVASISVDGKHWQRSAAEVLMVGDIPPILVLEKSDGKSFVNPGATNNYIIKFKALRTDGWTYNAVITDVLDTLPTADKATLSVPAGGYKYCFIDASDSEVCANPTISYNPLKFTMTGLVAGTEYYIKVDAVVSSDIEQNAKVANTVTFEVENTSVVATDTDIVASAYAQEDFGGDIYVKGDASANPDLRLGDPNLDPLTVGNYNAQYLIAAEGTISAVSRENWLIRNYKMRSGSGSDFDSTTCAAGSACQVMEENTAKLLKNGTKKVGVTSINVGDINFDTDVYKTPEGSVWIYNANSANDYILTISGSGKIKGRGTIVVKKGDLKIESNLEYYDDSSIVGFIVLDGDVIIDQGVENIVGLFYIPKGKFKSGDDSADQKKLTTKGIVVARGFDLTRTNIGKKSYDATGSGIDPDDQDSINSYCRALSGANTNAVGSCFSVSVFPGAENTCAIIDCLNAKEPAEIFRYDARVLFTPPPGFGGKFLRSLN